MFARENLKYLLMSHAGWKLSTVLSFAAEVLFLKLFEKAQLFNSELG
jgi:hypothetical protein